MISYPPKLCSDGQLAHLMRDPAYILSRAPAAANASCLPHIRTSLSHIDRKERNFVFFAIKYFERIKDVWGV